MMTSACRSNAEPSDVHIHEDVSGVLRIAYADESDFHDRFGRIFKFYYPNVQLRIVSASYPDVKNTARLQEYLERESPDVLVLDRIMYAGLSRQGFLVHLDDWFVNESIDPSSYADTVMDALSKDGGGNIYGFAPFFVSRVLFYNKDLFDQYGIPYPESGMTWDQVLELALQFARKGSFANGHYGFHYFNSSKSFNPFHLVRTIAESENIRLANDHHDIGQTGSRIEAIYRLVIEGLRLGAIAPPVDDLLNEGFNGGQAGMMVGNYYDLRDSSIWSFQWGIASEPSPDGTTPNYQLDTIFAVPLTSANQELALEFIRFLMSEEYMRLKGRYLGDDGLPMMKSILDGYARLDVDLSNFYSLSPIAVDEIQPFINRDIPGFQEITREYSLQAVTGELTIEESLQLIEQRLRENHVN
jgi:multiple sugar transport system substrate-binding protein